MRDLKSVEELQAKFRAKAKAAKAGTMRAKVLKRIDDWSGSTPRRRGCSVITARRFCPFAPCRRARACKGDADACLKRSVDQVPRHEIWQTSPEIAGGDAAPLRCRRAQGPPEVAHRVLARACRSGAGQGACRDKEITPT